MALSFIGKPISLISHLDIRYRGILAGIDPAASTIKLSNVYAMGTETRRPPAEFIPPAKEPYRYIIFRASEVKDLAVDEPAPKRTVHDDPAVLGASAPTPAAAPAYLAQQPPPPSQPGPNYTQPIPQLPNRPSAQVNPQQAPVSGTPTSNAKASPQPKPQQPAPQKVPQQTQVPPPQQQQQQPQQSQPQQQQHRQPQHKQQRQQPRRSNSGVQTAAASLETVERALGDLRVGGGGRVGGTGPRSAEISVPATDFDFEGSNAKFDKAALAPKKPLDDADVEKPNDADAEEGEDKGKAKAKDDPASAYNPQKSFFDSLSFSAPALNRGGRRGGGNSGRTRREEERERNVATFGEPGGVGLMGPGAYVGGHGRRGGRPRRGQGHSARN